MNLIIDQGNTFVKFAVFNKGKLLFDESFTYDRFVDKVKEIFKSYPKINRAIISTVGELNKKDLAVLSLFAKVHVLSHKSKVPFKNSYATPHTLGIDRIALITAAYYHNPHRNTLVIDAGTCVTYDIINDFDEYLGGAISPGLQMRYKAMHEQTANLPLLEKEEIIDFIGNATNSSMHSGVVNGLTQEISGVVHQYGSRFKDLTVILTGGDAQFLSKRLKNTIFADSKFLLKGLNYLLEYNKH
ncbi:type III pantothenate kinase [Maribacter sp. MJ134]|uniref:type III pantothenate kinase n=1 Tax=Maribacter sp. MJ134 TaxID=2496865 RepID=UPI000F84C08D|nr:type III pantothenate kinase [Maribacter sp. MJ134]AZQ60273.1 type III pantothenate kinase [Maribacter sp. MJ134]